MFKKAIISAVAVSAVAMCATAARADVIPTNSFTISDGQYIGDGTIANTYTANRIVGGYTEFLTFNTDRTAFQASLVWNAGQYFAAGSNTAISTFSNASVHTGLLSAYELYALYQASGTVSYENGGAQFNFTSGTGSLQFYIDRNHNTSFSDPVSGASAFGRTNASDDVLLAEGIPTTGAGDLKCISASNCGSFGAEAEIQLTSDGAKYFVAPSPFYGLSLQSGQFNNNFLTTPDQTTYKVDGSLDVTFAVPEPGMVGLLGLGMLAAAVSRRKGAKRKIA